MYTFKEIATTSKNNDYKCEAVRNLRLNIFLWIDTSFRGELRILAKIEDGALRKNSKKTRSRLLFLQSFLSWMGLQGSEYVFELASKVFNIDGNITFYQEKPKRKQNEL